MIMLDVGKSMTTDRQSSAWLDAAVRAVTLLVHQKVHFPFYSLSNSNFYSSIRGCSIYC
jgi:hypothetical protein